MSSILTSDLLARIRATGARRLSLQFPEGLKRQAFPVARALRAEGYDVIISGDPCYGACDLAEDTLAFADVLVHFGHAPVEDRDGVIYEYVRYDFDPAVVEAVIPLLRETEVGLVTTIQHAHLIDDIAGVLESHGITAVIRDGAPRAPFRGQVLGCSFEAAKRTGAREVLFVGTGVFHPIGIRLATGARVVAFDPVTGTAGEVDADALLRRRFAQIEKARDAASTGIILSTKTGQARREEARRLLGLREGAFCITLREVSPDALLNLGFGCYVNTACPRLAYDDQVRFPVPVLSPPEYEIVCGVRDWDDYQIDEIR
ncbi:diphthamide biosynthesis protein [Methanomicrobiaceae archaeon CYW5]|uniref:diphthamide biosynthesis enzyme Dph2 n=1 Tax=Methanovulcanius yangii TaxID=1789227 RepID=UPI0029CA10B6|nr:diphthamide biosynthesis enzyme Dph2 [Methanovulcanius yangii]MBT8508135.1 diphthamide biosynthesis protein [Methanovulcanius yangii]